MFGLSPTEIIIIGIVAVLLYGSRLPEVSRSWGKSLMEFKKGLNGVKEEFHSSIMSDFTSSSSSTSKPSASKKISTYQSDEDYEQPSSPKFEPPPAIEAEAKSELLSADQPQVS